ncbi:uncharacterized protein EV422DRAFT_160652 [Fimicolochytrium jonesii]|uniref:uncharacterized protein n=1 Tax=Fimicolochytrium jonesii TaxID=1396493 RepID=UPI0022FEADFA|nr:uncharacterized protein EV422DRAFT_160652 [Fimicolochytrium jonesii]KAI8826273.1 hypothetical protein EV422DRAFT_160652 [Fimicolochytrium jonesii]
MTDVKLSTAVYEPEAPLSSVVLNMAVADFTQFTNSVPNIFGTLPFGKNVNYATGALAVDAASWNGKSFHGQPYVVQIQATSAAGLVSSRSSTVIVDGTPPSSGYVRFNQSYYDPTVTSAVSATFGGIADLESGIKEFYYRWGSDNSFCTGADFALPLPAGSKWQPFSLPADADAYAPDEQTVLLKLGNVNASKVYLGIAGVNRAATAGSSMSQSVSFSCSLGLVVDSTGPSIDINSIEIVQATLFNKKQYLSGVERTVTAKWCALASLSGVSYYNASLYFDDKLAVGPSTWYTNSATLSYKESGPLPASTKVKLCVTAMSYAHRVVGPVCQDTLINTVEPDFSTCSTAGMTLPTSANSMATLQLDWMSCVSATYMVDHYEYNIVKNGQIEYGGKRGILSGNTTSLALPLNSTVVIGKIVVCLTPVDMFGDSHQPFCTNPVTIDSTVPMPTGGVRNIDPATKLPIQTTTSLTGLSVGWDAWQDAATFISNYTVTITAMSLNKTESVFAGPVTLSTVDLKPHADGTFSHDFSGYRVVVGSTYTASIYATNAAGLSSGPTNSSGIKAVDPALFPDPVVTILDGIVLQTQSTLYRLIPQGKDQKLHITWQKFRGFSGANRVSYAVQFVSELDNQASNITVGSSLDALVAIPSNPGAYRVYVNLLLTDGANATTIAKTALAPEKLIISETIGFTPGVGESSCDVQFDVSSVSVPRPAATLQAKWPKFVDTYGLISNYRLAFRRQGQTFRTSSWSEVGSSSQSFAGKVAYPYGVPNMLTPWQLECVIEAVDVANRSSSITVPARWTTLTTPKNKAAVVSVPLTKLSQTPANSSDFGFLEEITMTAGGDMTFAAAFFGFPQLQSSGTQLATVQYSVGNAMSNTTGIFDNIIPLTALDLSGATNQSMLIEGTYVPVHMFAVPITYLDATPVSVCVNVTVQATSESVFTCSAGVAADSNPPAVGTTEISLGAQYATTSSSLVITWDGFTSPSWLHPNGSGIAFYQWTLGTYPGGDDIVSATRSYPSAGRALVTGIKLLNGYSYFATVIATADNGLSSNATSDEVIIDYTPPRSASGITAIRPIQVSDKVWNVRIEYDHWTDLETRVASVTWVIETQYGYGDVLPATRTDTPTSAEAKNLQLGVGITYVVRVIATNTAGLAQESIRSFTVPYPVWILSLVDGAAIGRSLYSTKAYSTEKSIYNLSWRLLGSPLYAEYALGTRPMQNDIYPWTRVTSETEASIILTEQFNDGLTLYASMRAFGENGIIADVISTAGITFDESPPLVGRVIQGRGTVHKLWTMSSAIVSFSWTGFLDRHSGIARHHYCIDADPDPKRCASEMTEIYGSTGVYSAGLDTELVVGKKYYIKIRATNGAGLSSYGMSPPFKYDPSPPTLGLVTVHHPSSADFIPAAHGGALIYQDWSTVQVSWTGFSDSDSGIANYQVALAEQESGQLVQQFVSVGGSTLWRFTDADGLLLEDGKKYFAVVLATNGAGAVSQATSGSFIVDTEPPSGGKVEVDFNPNGISTTIDGFFDKTSEIVEYRILIGSFRGANDVAPTRVLQMGSGKDCNPCVETFPISLQENAMYFVTGKCAAKLEGLV